MKRYRAFVLIALLFNSTFIPTSAQNVAINATGNDPDASAMLDIQSSNSGLLIPRVSLSSLTDASAISNPASSLLIFNSNAALAGGKGFYYNSGTAGSPVWTKLMSTASVWNTTGNTNTSPGADYIGTTDAKDLVVKTNATQRIKVSSTGITTIGDGTNDLKIEADGSVFLEGEATAFNDIVVPLFNTRLGNTNQPIWSKMKDNGSGSRGVYTFTFEDVSASSEQEVYFSVQLPHNWKEGTAILPHVHWSPQTTGKTGAVVWGLEYTWVNYVAASPITFPATTIITNTSITVNGSTDQDKHLLTQIGTITPDNTQNKISSILMCRFFRKSGDAADTYNGNAAVLSVDFHYEIDAIGSRQEYIK